MTDLHRGSAQIYQFPARGRFAADAHREDAKPAANLSSPHAVKAAVGSGWYHEQAIEEAERERNN